MDKFNKNKKSEEARKAEEDRLAAEREFLERHERERRLSSHKRISAGTLAGGYSSAISTQDESESEADRRKRPRSSPEEKEKKKKTRKTDDSNSEDENEEEDEGDAAANLVGIVKKIKAWIKQPAIIGKVTKPQVERFMRYIENLQEEVTKLRIRDEIRAEIVGEGRATFLNCVKEEITKRQKPVEKAESEAGPSFAEVTSRPSTRIVPKVTGVKGPVLPAPRIVLVRHETKESEEVKSTLKKLVKPSEIGLKVKRLINIRNGVMVEAENEEGIDKLMQQKALKEAGLVVEKPPKKRPVIMVFDVNATLKDEEIREEVYARNMQESGLQEEELKEEFQVRHRYKDIKSAGKKAHIVVECSVRVRNWLRQKEKIFVEWQCCRVKDYVDVARCYKCQRFGHIAKYCTAVKPCCSHCAGEHDYKDCENRKKKEAVCCANCKRESRVDVKHQVGSRSCPAYERAVRRYNEKIDYGL